ncbi:MAG: hypothetical protein GXP45_05030 [bacterium]|nr:hypothetical protein [bacterium]
MRKEKIIFPLFQNYLMEVVFPASLIGKIGMIGDFADLEKAQDLIEVLAKQYSLSSQQLAIKKFHFPFVYWGKQVMMWKYYLTSFSYSNFMVNKQVKFDLKYFKDANVDSLIPLNYAYFAFEKTIKRFFNPKKTKFHGLDALFKSLEKEKESSYAVKIFYSSHNELLVAEKRIMWLLQRGKSIDIIFEKID